MESYVTFGTDFDFFLQNISVFHSMLLHMHNNTTNIKNPINYLFKSDIGMSVLFFFTNITQDTVLFANK